MAWSDDADISGPGLLLQHSEQGLIQGQESMRVGLAIEMVKLS